MKKLWQKYRAWCILRNNNYCMKHLIPKAYKFDYIGDHWYECPQCTLEQLQGLDENNLKRQSKLKWAVEIFKK